MAKNVLLLDFDDTVFNVQLFKQACAKSLGLTLEAWVQVYEAFVQDNGVFDPVVFLEGASNQEKQAFQHVVQNSHMYVYPDAISFIQTSTKAGWEVVILSYGDPAWQRTKIDNAGLPSNVHIIVTDASKADAITNYTTNPEIERIVFVDDRAKHIDAVKAAWPHVECFWMKRSNGAHTNTEPAAYDKIVEDLTFDL